MTLHEKKGLIIIVIIIFFTLVSAFFINSKVQESKRLKPLFLTVADANQPVFALLYIADRLGYFNDLNLHISYKKFISGRDALNATVNGEADVATVFELPVIKHILNGNDIGIISELHRSQKNTSIVANKKHGILQPSDLKGKRIGLPIDTNAEYFLFLFLESNGLSLSDITMVDISPEDLELEFASGNIDAVVIWQPYNYTILNSSKNDNIQFFSNFYTEISMLVADKSIIATKKESLERFIEAIVLADEYINAHPSESLLLLQEHFVDQPRDLLTSFWSEFSRHSVISNILLTVLEQESRWYAKQNNIESIPSNFNGYIIGDFLQRVSPKSVTIF